MKAVLFDLDGTLIDSLPNIQAAANAVLSEYSLPLLEAQVVGGFVGMGEKVFVDRLIAMGARVILCDPHRAVVVGPSRLRGGSLESPDIRAGMALLLAALGAEGTSTIHNIGQIERGYERIDERLRGLGARIERADPSPRE